MVVVEMVVTAAQVLKRGLELVGFSEKQINGVRREKNLSRFRAHYTNSPVVYAIVFHSLQAMDNLKANIIPLFGKVGQEKVFDYFFCAIHLLACYPTEEEAEAVFNHSNVTWSDWSWDILERISLLLPEFVGIPERWDNPESDSNDETIFIMTVDGIHCSIEEPSLKLFSENRKFFSHKYHGAGLDYELGISIFQQKCVWVRGPYPAGTHDATIFRDALQGEVAAMRDRSGVQHRVIADRGYRGNREFISTPNSHDDEPLRDFKGRALSRHETFNGRLKNFDSLQERFRHSVKKHKMCFNAGVVIVQISLEHGSPLFIV